LDESRLSPIIQSTIFRVIQEALTNVSRHAKTKTAAVTLAAVDDTVQFSVRDNGKGFDAADAARNSSTGLSSMRERVSLVGGKFEISSTPRKGTIITARIPLPRQLATNSEQNRTDYGQNSSTQTHHR
jgi:signal transduction histidine kinase